LSAGGRRGADARTPTRGDAAWHDITLFQLNGERHRRAALDDGCQRRQHRELTQSAHPDLIPAITRRCKAAAAATLVMRPLTTHIHARCGAPLRLLCSAAGDVPFFDAPLLTSRDNAKLKLVRKLRDSRRQRQREGLVVLEGARLVLDGLAAGFSPELLVLSEAAAADASLRASLAANRDSVVRVPDALMGELCDTTTPQGVLAVLPQPSLPLPPAPSLVLVCDTVGDPGNLGTLLRSAAGAGADAALLLPGCVDAWGPKALRAGMGAQLRLPLAAAPTWADAARQLRGWGCEALAADAGGAVAHFEWDWTRPTALVVGSEAHGLSDEIKADPAVTTCSIPLHAGVESLNAGVAGSVMLYEAARQRAA